MENIISYFDEKSIKKISEKIEAAEKSFWEAPETLSDYIMTVHDGMMDFGRMLIATTLNAMNDGLRESPERASRWNVKDTKDRKLITSMGEIVFRHTLFSPKTEGHSRYLLDEMLGLDSNQRLTEDATARLLEEAASTSYQRGGKCINSSDPVTRQTVMNKLRAVRFPEEQKPEEKRKVSRLYIEADEDHVALQGRSRKGGDGASEEGKGNTAIAKIVYVHEGVEKDAPAGKRRHLVNAHYFAGMYPGKENRKLWDEVYEYVDGHYDLDSVDQIYLGSDGGSWIKGAQKAFKGITVVLDEFHLSEHFAKITAFLGDSSYDARQGLREAIRGDDIAEFNSRISLIESLADAETDKRRINDSADYIRGNWDAAGRRLRREKGIVGCSTEGHVSHVLSSRMSSRPMGWSRAGIDKMCRLRAYFMNGGNAYKLAKYQKTCTRLQDMEAAQRDLPMASGMEGLSCTQVLRSERNPHGTAGKYFDKIIANVSPQVSKQAWYRSVMKSFSI